MTTPTNDFQAFGTGPSANVLSQSAYLTLAALVSGFPSGILASVNLNKVLRQATFGTAVLGQLICDETGSNATDDGNISEFEGNLKLAVQALAVQAANAQAPATVAVTGGTVTLTATQAASRVIRLTGTLTSNLTLVFPESQNGWIVQNGTSGAYTVTCQTAAAAGSYIVRQGFTYDLYCDGTNILPDGSPIFSGSASVPTLQLNEIYLLTN